MKFLKIAVLPVILLSLAVMGGCVTETGPKVSLSSFEKISSLEIKKVSLSLPVVVEKDMETKKNPDATEKAVAGEVYAKLKENLSQKGLLASKDSVSLSLDLRVHYVNRMFAEWEYFTSSQFSSRMGGGQIIMVRVKLKKNNSTVIQIDSLDNTGTMLSRNSIVHNTAIELANQIEKILKEVVNVGKSP